MENSPLARKPANQITRPTDVAGLRVLVVGLGRFGGGIGVTRWLVSQGARVTVTDLADRDQLADSFDQVSDIDVTWHLGGHDPADLDATDLVVVNPAVNKTESDLFRALTRRRIPYTTETNLFCALCPAPTIAVTGSFGKSTTCAMLARALEVCLRDGTARYTGVHVGGNIGRSLLTSLTEIQPTDHVVLEMSDAQLEDLPMIPWTPALAVITNLSPHHLNRYSSYEAYLVAKLNIVGSPKRADTVIVGDIDLPAENALRRTVADHVVQVARVADPCPPIDLRIPGAHNQSNAACVLTVCNHLGLDETVVREALGSFPGLPHRLEFVRTLDGLDYYNDSKATSPTATVRAVESFKSPIVAIVGGQDLDLQRFYGERSCGADEPQASPCAENEQPTEPQASPCANNRVQGRGTSAPDGSHWAHTLTKASRAVICTGQSGPAFAAVFRAESGLVAACQVHEAGDLEEALALARCCAQAGDVVLFSPGAPSFDRYPNFAARGRHFVELVNALQPSTRSRKLAVMATKTTINRLCEHVGQEVTLQGWVYKTRASGKIAFIVVRDGTGLCQCVLEKNEKTEPFFAEAKKLAQESSLEVTGTVTADGRAVGGHELQVTCVNPVHAAHDYPITPKPHGIDFLMKQRHLWFRSQRQWQILRIRATVVDQIRRFYNDNGYVLIDTPIFAPAAGEGAQTLFKVDYFGEPVYLAQTGQLYLEAACMAHGKVYCFGPTFRAEKSKTRRHLTEFWMVEPEIAYTGLSDVMDVAEDFICSIVDRVLKDHREALIELGRNVDELEAVKKPFVRITYTEATDLLHGSKAKELLENDLTAKTARVAELDTKIEELEATAQGGGKQWQKDKAAAEAIETREERSELQEQIANIPFHMKLAADFEWGSDLGGSDETIISRIHDRPVFVTHYPKHCKAFYMRLDRNDDRVSECFDLLAPQGFGEIIGGSAREEDHDRLLGRIDEEGLDREDYEWYLDLRRYGSVPHGGFGLGVERTVAWLCGLKHIRETIPYPRMMGKVYP